MPVQKNFRLSSRHLSNGNISFWNCRNNFRAKAHPLLSVLEILHFRKWLNITGSGSANFLDVKAGTERIEYVHHNLSDHYINRLPDRSDACFSGPFQAHRHRHYSSRTIAFRFNNHPGQKRRNKDRPLSGIVGPAGLSTLWNRHYRWPFHWQNRRHHPANRWAPSPHQIRQRARNADRLDRQV